MKLAGQLIKWDNFGPEGPEENPAIPLRFQAKSSVRNGTQGYNSSNTRFGADGYFYHSFSAVYNYCCLVWAFGFNNPNGQWELFAREYQPGIGNQQLSSATYNPINESKLILSPPHPSGFRYQTAKSPLFKVTKGNQYELGCAKLAGGGNIRLYSVNVLFFAI